MDHDTYPLIPRKPSNHLSKPACTNPVSAPPKDPHMVIQAFLFPSSFREYQDPTKNTILLIPSATSSILHPFSTLTQGKIQLQKHPGTSVRYRPYEQMVQMPCQVSRYPKQFPSLASIMKALTLKVAYWMGSAYYTIIIFNISLVVCSIALQKIANHE